MKRVLLPIDGSQRSARSLDMAKRLCNPDETDIYIVKVVPSQLYMRDEEGKTQSAIDQSQLEAAAVSLMEFNVHTKMLRGSSPGVEILEFAKANNIDTVILTRSSRGPLRKMGSVTSYLVNHASSLNVFVLREEE